MNGPALVACVFLLVLVNMMLPTVYADHKYQSGGLANELRKLETKYLPDSGRHKRHEVWHRGGAAVDRVLKNFDGGKSKASQIHNTKRADYHRDARRAAAKRK
jgi:hypothetical protein